MENKLEIYSNEEFGSVRTVVIEDEPWFVGKDVAVALGYKDTSDALKKHVDDDDKLTRRFADSGQQREMYVINESGLYSLIMASKLPNAKKFKHWVTSEVLPSIRKNGMYITDAMAAQLETAVVAALAGLKDRLTDIENGISAARKQMSYANYYLRLQARSGYDTKWISRESCRLKALAEYMEVDQKYLLREIYREMESRYGIVLNDFVDDYKRTKGVSTCSTMSAVSFSHTLREMFDLIVDELIDICGLEPCEPESNSHLFDLARCAAVQHIEVVS